MKQFGSTTSKSAILSNFITTVMDEILKHKSPDNLINGHNLKKIIESKIQTDTLMIKSQF